MDENFYNTYDHISQGALLSSSNQPRSLSNTSNNHDQSFQSEVSKAGAAVNTSYTYMNHYPPLIDVQDRPLVYPSGYNYNQA